MLFGLILTHNLSTSITCIFALFYTLAHFNNLKETRVKKGLLLSFIFIITITSFFWAPMLETKLSTDYQVYEKDAMASKESVASHALEVKRLFATGSEEIYVLYYVFQ